MSDLRGVAAFDVDGTLTTRDCVVPFLLAVGGRARTIAALARRAHRLGPALLRRDRDAIKAIATAAVFTDRPASDVEAEGKRFAARVLDSWMCSAMVVALRDHHRRGHQVVLVSASYGAYVHPLGAELGVDAVICTELEVGSEGCCTGELDGGNCRGAAKVDRLHDWLATHHGGRAAVELWAYGDSPGDQAMLDDAEHPMWVEARRMRRGRRR